MKPQRKIAETSNRVPVDRDTRPQTRDKARMERLDVVPRERALQLWTHDDSIPQECKDMEVSHEYNYPIFISELGYFCGLELEDAIRHDALSPSITDWASRRSAA